MTSKARQGMVRRARGRTRGSAMLIVIVFVSLVAGLGAALLGFDLQTGRSRRGVASEQRAFYAAEAALNEGYAGLLEGSLEPLAGETLELGDVATPRALGSSRHWGTVTRVDARRFSLVGSGRDAGSLVRHEMLVSFAPNGPFQYAAFGADGVQLDSDTFVDSFDSMLGDYASQVAAGTDYGRERGAVGSNGDIHLSGNTEVHGDCRPGPGGALYATDPGILVTGSTDPALQDLTLPVISPPAAASLGDLALVADVTLGPGLLGYGAVEVAGGATLTVVGPTQLVLADLRLTAGTTLVLDASAGPIELYAAHDFVLASGSVVQTQGGTAADVKLFVSGDNRTTDPTLRAEVVLDATSEFVGAILAPNAGVRVGSGFEVFGSVMAGALDLSSNGRVHFDEALRYDRSAVDREFVTLIWRPLGRGEE